MEIFHSFVPFYSLILVRCYEGGKVEEVAEPSPAQDKDPPENSLTGNLPTNAKSSLLDRWYSNVNSANFRILKHRR